MISNKPKKETPYEYYAQYDIPTLVISEQFSPLIGVDVSMKSGANFGFSYRKARNLALSISDTRLQETKTSDITVKFGHRVKNVYIKFLDFNLDKKADAAAKKKKKEEDKKNVVIDSQPADPNAPVVKKKKEPKPKKGNDLVLNFDLTFRDDITENHLLGQGVDVPSRGSQTLRLALRASGYFALRPHLEKVPVIRILVGINVDEIMEAYHRKGRLFLADAGRALAEWYLFRNASCRKATPRAKPPAPGTRQTPGTRRGICPPDPAVAAPHARDRRAWRCFPPLWG